METVQKEGIGEVKLLMGARLQRAFSLLLRSPQVMTCGY